MVHAAEADIITPAVTTEDPLGLLGKEVFLSQDLLSLLAAACLEGSNQLVGSSAVGDAYAEGIQPFLTGSFDVFLIGALDQSLDLGLEAVTDRLLSQIHAVTELCVVLEQGVRPCRTLTLGIDRVRCGG